MKLNTTLAALATATLLTVPALAQTPPSNPPTQPTERQQPTQMDAPRTQSLRGSLVRVDTDKMKLTIKDTAGVEHTFRYNPQTEVIGSQEGVAGLATKAGTNVTVHYKNDPSDRSMSETPGHSAEKVRIATKIEIETN